MNLDCLTAVLSHIGNLIVNLTKKNLIASVQEIKDIFSAFGGEAEQHLYRLVLSQLEWLPNPSEPKKSSNNGLTPITLSNSPSLGVSSGSKEKELSPVSGNTNLVFATNNGASLVLLIQQLISFLPLQRFAASFAVAISLPLNSTKTIRQGWVSGIFKLFKLTKVQEVVVALELLHSLSAEVRNQSTALLKTKLPELLRTYIEADSAGREISELSTETFHLILTQAVYTQRDQTTPILGSELRAQFASVLQKEFPRTQAPLVLLPILYPESDPLLEKLNLEASSSMAKNLLFGSLADLVLEMGYNFCYSVDDCRNTLTSFGSSNITPVAVAKVIGLMVKTHSGLQSEQMGVQNLSDPNSLWNENKDKNVGSGRVLSSANDGSNFSGSWNVEIFIKALLEAVPSINVQDVIMKLDYKGFLVKDKQGLKLLFTSLRCLMQGQELRQDLFPVECLYRQWKNAEEQCYILEQILNNPDVFCFADFHCHLVNTEGLKALPELDNKAVATWKSLELIELLLCLADSGHGSFVKELFKFPIQHCPDVLALGLLQVTLRFTILRQELISSLIPTFLGTHPNAAVVLQQIWLTPKDNSTVRQIMMHAMAEWYMVMENDQTRLSRILDVAQDLKCLSLLLNAQPFIFVIDLACLAYRREYLKLDKWMSDKIRDHGEQFISSCVKFLQRRCPQLIGGKEDILPKSTQLPSETVSTMLICLQSCVSNLPPDLSETVLTMAQNCTLLSRPRQVNNLLTFPTGSDSLGGIASSLSNLNIGGAGTTSIFANPTAVSSSMGLSNLGSLGTAGGIPPSSPAVRPSLPPASSQSSLSSILPSLPLTGPPHPAVGSQLQSLSTSSIISSSTMPPAANRSQSAQPAINQPSRPVNMELREMFDGNQNISKEVEDEANSYFQRIYNHPPHPTLSIEEVLKMLENFHKSPIKREQEVYSCMLKNLFEEYRFFPTYPNRELILTAQLFGGIIDLGIVEYIALGVALRYVLEGVSKPLSSKMYYFGIVAVDQFRKRLKEYPRYCQFMTTLDHFSEFPDHLKEWIEYGSSAADPPNNPTGVVIPQSMNLSPSASLGVSSVVSTPPVSVTTSVVKPLAASTATTTSSAVSRPQSLAAGTGKPTMATTNIETLLVATEKEDKLSAPPDHIQDKIGFIFNNLSQINLPQKCEELKEVLSEDFFPWIAQYLVMKRASIENQFHTLYSLFLDQLNMTAITTCVLQETLRNVKVLLRADKSAANFSDKSLLKNLGHWLGMLTIAKNKPILHIDIDVKSLLIEAYKKGLGEMQYVVPFVAKIIESCAKSRVFKPPNPWTMALMNVLAELHREPDMKLHLKFEIEVLCNKLELNVKDLKPGNVLKNPEKLARLKYQLSQPGGKRAESTPLFSTLQGDGGISTQSSSAGATPTPPALSTAQSSATPTQIQTLAQSEPRFVYNDISLSSLRCFDTHVSLTTHQLGNVDSNTQLKQLVKHAVESAVQEIITAVIERSIKVAITTTEHIIKKDFALEPDESRMRAATHHIVRNLTAAMAMITSKDHLTSAIAKGIKQGILTGFSRTNPQQVEQVEQLANNIAAENTGIACAFIQKTAAEKAVLEMDKRFTVEYDARKLARSEGRRYWDTRVSSYHTERMPEPIRMKVGRITQQQTAVYEEFARNIPGFIPVIDEESVLISKPIPLNNTSNFGAEEEAFYILTERLTQELDNTIPAFNQLAPTSHFIPLLHSLLEGIIHARTSRETTITQLLVKRCVDNLLEGMREIPQEPEMTQIAARFRDMHLIVLKAIADPRTYGQPWTAKIVTKYWTEAREEVRYNVDVFDCLLRYRFINVTMLDEFLVRIDENRPNYAHLLFVMQLLQNYLLDDQVNGAVLTEADLSMTLEALLRFCQSRQAPEGLINLIDNLRMKHDLIASQDRISSGSNALTSSLLSRGVSSAPGVANNLQVTSSHHFHSGVTQARDFNDPHGLQEKTDLLLRQWIQMYHAPNAGQGSTTAFQHFVKEMDLHGILKTDEVITRFFRICITMCRDLCVRSIRESGNNSSPTYVRNKCFPNLDAFVRLIALLVKQSGEPSNPTAKINLLNKILGLVCGILIHDQDTHLTEFHQLPYHRILIMLFLELNAPETVLESINIPVLMAFTQTLHLLRPTKCPGFAYAWLEMVSHRVFIGRMLAITPQQKGWSMYSMLLTDLFKFLAPFLRNVDLSKPLTVLYKGTLRVLLVLLHDFPEFLCEYHYTFCDVIPPNCIQMRNLILSAYPRNMRLPDPFMPNLKVDILPEISVSPKIPTSVGSLIAPPEFKKNLDSYLKNRTPVTFLTELKSYLQQSNEPGVRYNMSMMNALVLYVGMQAIAQIQSKGVTPSMPTIAHSSHMDIFQNLAVALDTEGRYLFLIAIANQLRYPNSHTHYFSCTLLYLFTEANTEAIQEQITRVLLERLIGNRPQPWGLLITFIELIKNPTFKFWSHEFVKCAPEIEKIFESVARSCMVSKTAQPDRD